MRPIAFITLALLAFSCSESKETEPDPVPTTEYFVVANKNGQSWSVVSEVQFSAMAPDTLYIFGGGEEGRLAIHFKFNGPGKYILGKNLGEYYSIISDDIITDAYQLDESSKAGELTVTHYDEHEGIIEGNFSMTLTRHKHFSGNETHVMTFTKGRFKGRITE
jgi:hypothetical protein